MYQIGLMYFSRGDRNSSAECSSGLSRSCWSSGAVATAERVGGSDRRVGELCVLLGRPQNLFSYHLGRLRSTQIVVRRQSTPTGEMATTASISFVAARRDTLMTLGIRLLINGLLVASIHMLIIAV
jgi:hypothetical protein